MKSILKKFLIKVYFGNPVFRKGIKFGKGSYVREHAQIGGGEHIEFGDNVRVSQYCRIICFDNISGEILNPKLTVGNNVFMGRNLTILCADSVVIEDDCLFGSFCFISDENHGMNPEVGVRYECQQISTNQVKIGKNCWIGEKAIILPGVTIGNNTIIGAGSVVTKDIPADSIAVGNPAKVIKKYNFDLNCWERIGRK